MNKVILALLLTGCATQAPAELVRINASVNNRATYQHYAKRDWRYLREGDAGNCARFAYTKHIELIRAGLPSEIRLCVLTSGEGHAFVVSDGWALDNRWDYPVPITEMDCR